MFENFNGWYVIVILFVLMAAWLGWKTASGRVKERSLKVNLLDGVLGSAGTIALIPLLFLESFDGAIGALGATADMARENPDYAISAALGIILAGVAFGILLAYISAGVRALRARYLARKKRLRFMSKERRLSAPSFILAFCQKIQTRIAAQRAKSEKRFILKSELPWLASMSEKMKPGTVEIVKIQTYSEKELKRLGLWRHQKNA